MSESVATRLARIESTQAFIAKEVQVIQEDMKGMRNSVRTMLFSLIGGFIIMGGTFLVTQAAQQ